ncbi:50S ribosomal protein L6 [Candidatus Woesearchaeota archaeon]|nr:50S ribosomal protein L6 [Candidatus Woesearchaeota archaeon]
MKKQKTGKTKLNAEISLPSGVTASLSGQSLAITGPKGESKRKIRQHNVKIMLENSKVIFETEKSTKRDKKLLGSLKAHVNNMIKGSIHQHNYTLKICAGHFPMTVAVADNNLTIKNFLGEKVPRVLQLKEGAAVKVDGQLIHVISTSKETAGQVAADIEQLTRRPGFDSRVFQDGIYIINKDGKELK